MGAEPLQPAERTELFVGFTFCEVAVYSNVGPPHRIKKVCLCLSDEWYISKQVLV